MSSTVIQVITLADDGSGTCEGWITDPPNAGALRTALGPASYESTIDRTGIGAITETGRRHVAVSNCETGQ